MTAADQRQAAFLAAICADPHDIGLRLVYADWLEEHDDSYGEFIRVQCEAAKIDGERVKSGKSGFRTLKIRSRYEALRCRERWLLREHHLPWCDAAFGPIGQVAYGLVRKGGLEEPEIHVPFGEDGECNVLVTFCRGFVEVVSCTCAAWQQHGPAIVQAAPVLEVHLSEAGWNRLEEAPSQFNSRPVLYFNRIPPWPWQGHHLMSATEEEADTQNSHLALAWARAEAGLPALKEKAVA